MRIRQAMAVSRPETVKDPVLAVDGEGDVIRVPAREIFRSTLKSSVRGAFHTTSDQTLSLLASTAKLPFNYEDFDENDEFDVSSYTFTSKSTGVFSINVQIKATNGVGVTTNFGAILKNGVVVARQGFAIIGVLSVNVSPSVRNTGMLLKLSVGDTVQFQVYSDLVILGLVGTRQDTFFSIHQVR